MWMDCAEMGEVIQCQSDESEVHLTEVRMIKR